MAEMPTDIQVKLLRALETKQIRRLGGKKEISVDIRILAATNKNLQKAIADGELREDLYYRLAVVEIDLPPLRERADDIQLLANEFLGRFSQQNGKTITGFEDAAWEWLMSYHWPGNVRELENCIERSVLLCSGKSIEAHHLPPTLQKKDASEKSSAAGTIDAAVSALEYEMIVAELKACDGNMAAAARKLGLTERQMGLRVKRLGIDFKRFRRGEAAVV
jgi:Nif-specific regulatory protein